MESVHSRSTAAEGLDRAVAAAYYGLVGSTSKTQSLSTPLGAFAHPSLAEEAGSPGQKGLQQVCNRKRPETFELVF